MLPPEAHAWAARRSVLTLLVRIDTAEGLTRAVIDRSRRWLTTIGDVISHRPEQRAGRLWWGAATGTADLGLATFLVTLAAGVSR
jgi:hypothetical protein